MFEILITAAIVTLILILESIILKIALAIILVILVLPGIYSMIKGAPFIPSKRKQITAMKELAEVTPKDAVVDLGCGDGRILQALTSKNPKKLVGFEFSLPTYLFAKILNLPYPGIHIKFKNFWKEDLSSFDVVICFLMVDTMKDFEKKIWPNLKKGTRVLSNAFKMEKIEPEKEKNGVILYIKN